MPNIWSTKAGTFFSISSISASVFLTLKLEKTFMLLVMQEDHIQHKIIFLWLSVLKFLKLLTRTTKGFREQRFSAKRKLSQCVHLKQHDAICCRLLEAVLLAVIIENIAPNTLVRGSRGLAPRLEHREHSSRYPGQVRLSQVCVGFSSHSSATAKF